MKLPAGKIETTYDSSEKDFGAVLEEVKEKDFEGYLQAVSDMNGDEVKSYIVFDSGKPVLAIFEEGSAQMQGSGAFEQILKACVAGSSRFEFHKGIDISLMSIYFPKAKIDEDVGSVDDILGQIDDIEKLIEEEKKRKEEAEKVKAEVREQIEAWKKEGYVTTSIEAALDSDYDTLKGLFEEYKEKMARLQELESEVDKFDVDVYGDKIKEILSMCNDPDKIEELEQSIKDLEEKRKEDEQRKEAVRKKIEQWQSEGYDTSRLEEALSKDVESLWEAYTAFFEDLQALHEIEDKLKELGPRGYDEHVDEINNLLKNPDKIEEAKAKVSELEDLIAKEKERREMIKTKVDNWAEEGYNVSGLESMIEEAPMNKLEESVENFENGLSRLEVIKDKLSGMNREWFPGEIDEIEKMLGDPSKLDEIQEKFKELMEKKEADEKRRVELREKIRAWKSQGYVVPDVDAIFQSSLPTVLDEVKKLEDSISKLKEYEEKLQELKTRGYEKEIMDLLSHMYDLGAMDEISEKYQALMDKVREDEKKREGLNKHIRQMEEEGFDVSSVKELMDGSLDKLWEEYTTVMDNVQVLKEAQERLDNINPIGHKQEVEEIDNLIKKPEMAQDVMNRVKGLEDAVNRELEARTEIKAKIDEYKEQGYDTSTVEEKITAPMEELEGAFRDFERGMEIINKIKQRIDTLDVEWYRDEVEEIKKKMGDPTKAEDLEVQIMELEQKIHEERKRREELAREAEEWGSRGYEISAFKEAIDSKPMNEVESMYTRFRETISKMDEHRSTLEGIEIYGHDEELQSAKEMMKDISNINTVAEKVENIKEVAEKEKQDREEMLREAQQWRGQGYKVDDLIEQVRTAPISKAKEVHQKSKEAIDVLANIEKELGQMKLKGHQKEEESIRGKLKTLLAVDEVKEEFENLKKVVEDEEQKREELKKRMEVWKNEGYNVSRLEQIIDGDLETIWENFTIMADDIQSLKEIENKLDQFKDTGHEEAVAKIKELTKDPENLKEAQTMFQNLSEKVEGEKKLIEQMKGTIERWKEEGYIITRLEDIDDRNYEKFREKVGAFQEDVNHLKDFKAELGSLDTRWHEDPVKEIREKLNNPDAIGIIERKMDELKSVIEAEQHERASLKEKIEGWKKQGFKVEEILEGFDDKSIDQIKKDIGKYEVKIKQLMDLQSELGVSIDQGEEGGGPPVREEPPTPLNEDYTFDSFVVGASNRFTHAAAQAVANNPANAYNPLFIYGGPGLGKTHLVHAIGNHIKKSNSDLKVMYITTERYINELLNAMRHNKNEAFRSKYRSVDVLLIDDIQFISGHSDTQEEFFHTFNSLYSARKQIVLTSDRPPKEIAKLEERLRSRFEGGLITDIQPPSLETKIIILRRIAKTEGITVPDEVIHLIGSNIKTNVRKLEGALNKLIANAKLNNEEITPQLAEGILRSDFLEGDKKGASPAPGKSTKEETGKAPEKPEAGGPGEEEKKAPEKPRTGGPGEEKKTPEKPEKPEAAAGSEAGPKPEPKPSAPKASDEAGVIGSKLASLKQKLSQTPSEEVEEGEPGAEKGPQMAECANCSELIPMEATECPHCGAVFEEPQGDMAECGNCGKLISIDATECPHCGASFVEGGEEGDEEEEEEEAEGEEDEDEEEGDEEEEEEEAEGEEDEEGEDEEKEKGGKKKGKKGLKGLFKRKKKKKKKKLLK